MPKNSIRDRFVDIQPYFTVDTAAYAQYDVVGNLPAATNPTCITIPNAAMASGTPVKLTHISLTEKGGQTPALSIYFFTKKPGSGTYTDNGAVVWGSEDAERRTGCVRIVSGDWHTNPSSAADAFVDLSGIEQMLTPADDSRDIYMLMVADSAYDAVAGTDLVIKLKFDRGGDNSR